MRIAIIAAATMVLGSCCGHQFAMGAGTTYCTPAKYDPATKAVVDETGEPVRRLSRVDSEVRRTSR